MEEEFGKYSQVYDQYQDKVNFELDQKDEDLNEDDFYMRKKYFRVGYNDKKNKKIIETSKNMISKYLNGSRNVSQSKFDFNIQNISKISDKPYNLTSKQDTPIIHSNSRNVSLARLKIPEQSTITGGQCYQKKIPTSLHNLL